jgi:UDP-N-acetylglucosamine diphosphorylase/glucosamine-1-phosphate N-acetyltransferase
MHIVAFEDPLVRQLEPVTLGRAAYSIACGSTSLADWLADQDATIQGLVRPYLRDWQAAEYPRFDTQAIVEGTQLLVNARLVPCQTTFNALHKLSLSSRPGLVFQGETLAAAVLPPGSPALRRPDEPGRLTSFLRTPPVASLPILEHRLPLLNFPHELVSRHVESIGENLQQLIRSGRYREVRDGVFLASNAELAEWAHTDTTQGPILLEPGCIVQPFACLRGPLYLGAMSQVNEHALLKPAVSVGTMCKVGGEIEASVIEAFTNKQHTGYLGHSYLGRWVNLGAGTSNSNLKNTYGTVRMEVAGRQLDTGMQFMGCVIGDFTKSAINTGIFTGKLIGGCSMVYGFVTTNVESFVNYARSFGEITDLSPAIMAQTQKRVFVRRGIEQQAWHVRLLRDMYEIAAVGRQLADRPVSL